MPLNEASASEQQAFDQMYESAMVDGVISVSELEVFALEAVQCTKRAGFKASLYRFDSETGAAVFAVEAEDPGEERPEDGELAMEPGDLAADECQTTYYLTPYGKFGESRGPTEQEAQLEQEQSEAAVLSCLAEAGFEFDDAMDGLASDEIPEEVYETCVRAYFE